MAKTKGHWPRGKRRNAVPKDWAELRQQLFDIGKQRLTAALARRIGVHKDTIFRWRRQLDVPEANRTNRLRKGLSSMLD